MIKNSASRKQIAVSRESDSKCGTPAPARGFTLVETMVAITVLTVAVAGPLVTANRAIVAAYTARDQLIASYLAQEGLEYVRAMRDNVYLANYESGTTPTAWDDFLNTSNADKAGNIGACRDTTTCLFDPAATGGMGSGAENSGVALTACSLLEGTCEHPLYLANGIYTQRLDIEGSKVTPFTRTILFEDIPVGSPSPTELRVTSEVTWNSHGTTLSVAATLTLTPWEL